MGTENLVKAVGKGTLIIETKKGRRYIREVILVSRLYENLLNVGQMLEYGYFLLGDYMLEIFDDNHCQN